MEMKDEKSWVAAAPVALPKKRKLPSKFRMVEIDEDELKGIFQFLGLEAAEDEVDESCKLEEADCEGMLRDLENKLLSSFRLTDHIEEQQTNLLGGQNPKRRKF